MAMINCPECGKEISSNAESCPYCGSPVWKGQAKKQTVSSYVTITSNKSKKTALMLCIFLGWCGIHQFYVGRIKTGFIYMFTLGFFGIGWFVDIISILLGTFRDNTGAPLRR